MHMCRKHWFMLPVALRFLIIKNYRKGQEIDKRPTRAYVEAVQRTTAWIAEHEALTVSPK